MTLLVGLSLLHVSRDAVHLKLVTAYPTGAVRGQDLGPCATADHELSLHLRPGSSTGAGEKERTRHRQCTVGCVLRCSCSGDPACGLGCLHVHAAVPSLSACPPDRLQ
jgi:hypothetical protein